VAAALVGAGAAPATSVVPAQKAALKALQKATIATETRAAARAEVNRAAHLVRILPSGRREHVLVALRELASFSGRLSEPRAISLLGTLKANDDYFAKHYAPAPQTDITDEDGVVYRYFAGRCFEFHPLANFGALNARIAAKDGDGTKRLADALIARGVYRAGAGVGWEYTFPYSGGRAPWLSGMAQAVAAQAFARAAALLPEEQTQLVRSAQAAYRAIPGRLLTSVAAGPWIRLYSFGSLRVLNAQLQAVISLQSYATAAEDADAAALALRMQRASAATLSKFDTGYWTYYALPHDPSPLDYQQYVVQLLKRLAPADQRFRDAATRIASYEKQPPAFQLATGALGALRFWLSKPATVSVDTAAGPSRRVTLGGGWHTLSWPEPKRPGIYGVRVTAVDYAGNRASFDALPLVRTVETATRKTSGTTTSPFLVGAALNDPSQSAAAARAGLRLVRLGVQWPAGSSTPDPTLIAALQRLVPAVGAVIELSVAPLPTDDATRAALGSYAQQLVAAVPSLSLLVLEPAVTTSTTNDYVAALNALRTALPTAPLGVALDGATDPGGALASLAGVPVDAYVLRPAAVAAKGAWTLADVPQAIDALTSTYGTPPPLFLDGVPPASVPGFACSSGVAAVLLDRLEDAAAPGVVASQRGGVVCPGVAAQVAATTIEYPTTLAQPLAVRLGCDRDCLYLVTLERGGKPVAARRGELAGGASPATIALPRAKLTAGSYAVRVRLVAKVNPGAVTTLSSPPLALSGS
jgi:hypothetical protein